MDVIESIAAMRRARPRFATLGLVPTMGYLHQGHLSLVQAAQQACGHVAVSIFVNPTQFLPHEDFNRYPRDPERDLRLLREQGVDVVFMPPVAEIYPPGFSTYVDMAGVTERLEGVARPGHFRGVATVVCKLFNIVQPDKAFFGQKDAQQCVVVRKMARELNMPLEVVIAPTVREADGLAMSSRNVYLSPDERRAAPVLHRALQATKRAFDSGERHGPTLRHTAETVLATESLGQPEYVSVADPLTLEEADQIGPDGALVSMAVRFGKTRLIDNILLED